jgi:hypothetical protein
MKILLPILAILYLFATSPLEAKILVLDANRTLKEGFEEVSTRDLPSGYQSEMSGRLSGALTKVKGWMLSEELATLGPLTIGLFLLILPLPFSRAKANLRDDRSRDGDSNLRRTGQSWDPRF